MNVNAHMVRGIGSAAWAPTASASDAKIPVRYLLIGCLSVFVFMIMSRSLFFKLGVQFAGHRAPARRMVTGKKLQQIVNFQRRRLLLVIPESAEFVVGRALAR